MFLKLRVNGILLIIALFQKFWVLHASMGPIDDPHLAQPLKRSVSISATVHVSMVVVRYSLPTVMATTEVAGRGPTHPCPSPL
ncbi:hypothetical protein Ahy_B01g051847 [Arachis hypogaea]|uniref:Secreted protein n=1 Tax=Arachis hypogaea TaxID=3818 RepID=A0A445AMX7_ARAHY|nr:hypothetical protein Ahy_B01g051847 [Arachis hypogaea]